MPSPARLIRASRSFVTRPNQPKAAHHKDWGYTIDLPVPDGTLRVTFDDWMWLLSEDRLLNRAYMERFGVTIGEVIITFEK